jgi:hypothetical protein
MTPKMLLAEAILTGMLIIGWIVLQVTAHQDTNYEAISLLVIGHFFGVSTGTSSAIATANLISKVKSNGS